MKQCSICSRVIADGYTCNAFPWEGRCCADCDNRWVTPARILHVEPDNTLLPILREFARLGALHSSVMEELKQRRCEACHGLGRVDDRKGHVWPCPNCSGSGFQS